MKQLIIIIALFVSGILSAQSNYEKGMQKALTLWQEDNWTEAEQLFERVAAAEPNEWLPNYYIAQMNSLKTWRETDAQKVKSQLDKAQEYLNAAMIIERNNADLMVMQAQVLTNWVAFDGMTYGMKYSDKITYLYAKAFNLEPDNPMVVLAKAEWNIGSARFFGKDTAPFCNEVKRAIELYANFKPKSEFYPNWGQEHAHDVLASCGK